jgi:hypothetical protein
LEKLMEIPRGRLKLRGLSLAEIVGIAALLVAALAYWDTHRDTVAREKAQAAEAATQAAKDTFLMRGDISGNGAVIRLTPARADQVIQSQSLWFPKAVRADKVETTGDPRVEADWIAKGVRASASEHKSGGVPVAVETVYIQDGQTRTDRTVYNVAYSLHHRLLQDDLVKLNGLSLARHGVSGDLQGEADKRWAGK